MKNLETLIQELCPDGVEFVKLGDVCDILDSKRKPVAKGRRIKGEYPYYGANGIQDYIDGYIFDGTYLLLGEDGSVINKDNSPVLNWATGKIWVNNHAHVLAERNDIALLRYLYYVLQTCDVSSIVRGMPPKLNQENLRNIEIPLPPIEVQTEIVRILDKFTSLEAELEAELDCRKRQYEYYRDKLLSFDNVGGQEVEWKKMSEVCLKTSKINWKLVEGEYKYIDLSSVDRDNHKISDCTIINKENAPSRAQQVVKTGDILFGTTRPTLMRFCYIPKEYDGEVCSTGYCVIRVNNEMINSHFAYHFLFTQKFQDYVEGHQKGASYPAISNKDVMSFELPIPSLQEQERIATILDRFESLTTSLQSGLPAEIAARRQQYEHYRDKLLTFKRKGAV